MYIKDVHTDFLQDEADALTSVPPLYGWEHLANVKKPNAYIVCAVGEMKL